MFDSITVVDVATPAVATAGPETTIREAARTLRESNANTLVVVGEDGPEGIVTDTDLRDVIADGRDPATTSVSAVMSSPIVTVAAEADVETAADRARTHGISKLPVVEESEDGGGEIVGVVTAKDLSYSLPEATDEDDRVELAVRAETAYERDDWTFEYEAPEDNADDRVQVGDVARFAKTVSEEDVRTFADASGDTNRLYLDEEFAERTRFGRRVAHSTLTTGLIGAVLTRLPGLTLALSTDLQYRGPIDLGERVTAVCEVIEEVGDHKYLLSVTVHGESGDPVIGGEATVLVDRLPEDS